MALGRAPSRRFAPRVPGAPEAQRTRLKSTRRVPLIQVETHGDRDSMGLSDEDGLTWQELMGALTTGTSSGDLAHVPAYLLVVVARPRSTREGRRATDGSRQRRYDVERVHAGARRIATRCRRQGRRRIVHNCSQTRRGWCGKGLRVLVRPARLERATSWFVGQCRCLASLVLRVCSSDGTLLLPRVRVRIVHDQRAVRLAE